MKNNFLHLFIIILCNVELIAHSYPPYSDIPEKYETWKNHNSSYDYGSVKSVLFIDKELFLKIVSAKELYFEYVLDGVEYRIPLQVPVLEDLPIEPYGQKAAGFGYIEVFFTLKDDSYQIADYNCNIESHFSFDEESGAEYPDPDGTIVYHKDLSQEEFLNILFDKSLGF